MRSKSLFAVLTLFLVVGFLTMLPLGSTLADNWTQVNSNGLGVGSSNTFAIPGAVYNNNLYIGVANQYYGCQVWCYDGGTWAQVSSNGFNDTQNLVVVSMATFGSYLYVGTMNLVTGGEVWRYDGKNWTQANTDGFGNKLNWAATSMAVLGDNLYVGAGMQYARVYRTGDGINWTQVNNDGFNGDDAYVSSLVTMGSNLYAGAYNMTTGCEVWSYNGTTWSQINSDGFSDKNNRECFITTDGAGLFIGTNNSVTGTEIWKYALGLWSQTNVDGFGDKNNLSAYPVTYGGNVYVGTDNVNGCDVWKYSGGAWSQTNADGFGVTANVTARLRVYNGWLIAGTQNTKTGCEVWKTQLGAPGLTVTSIAPSSGTVDTTVNITNLAGTGFVQGSTTTQVRLERSGATTINATSVAVPSSTQITCTLNLAGAQAGAYDVVVRNPNGQEVRLGGGFTVNAANPCGGGAAISVALAGLMFGLMSLAGSGSLRKRLGKTHK